MGSLIGGKMKLSVQEVTYRLADAAVDNEDETCFSKEAVYLIYHAHFSSISRACSSSVLGLGFSVFFVAMNYCKGF